MKKKIKKLLLALLLVAAAACLTYMVYVHRRVIRAILKGEPVPACPPQHHKGCCRGQKQ